jgi:hypothetical protein
VPNFFSFLNLQSVKLATLHVYSTRMREIKKQQ